MLILALALSGLALADNAVVGPGDSIVAVIDSLPGGGPHYITFSGGGNYVESAALNVGSRNLTISATGADNTFWFHDGPEANVITVGPGGHLTLEDIHLSGATAPVAGPALPSDPCDYPADKRAITAEGSVDLLRTTVRCFMTAGSGGAIELTGDSLMVVDSLLEFNYALGDGGHIATASAVTVDIEDSTLRYGAVDFGSGGAVHLLNSPVSLSNNLFEGNTAVVAGGAVYVETYVDTASVHANTFLENSASTWVPVGLPGGGYFNVLEGEGGAAWIRAYNLDVWNNFACGNEAADGGAVMISDTEDFVVENNVFTLNIAENAGGGLMVETGHGMSDLYIGNNDFLANVAASGGGAYFGGGNPVFENNLVAFTSSGSGLSAIEGPSFAIGDPIVHEYNVLWANCGNAGCDPLDPAAWTHKGGALAGYPLVPTEYEYTPWPDRGDYPSDCALLPWMPDMTSPMVDNGSPAIIDVGGSQSDIGAFGGPRADSPDRDGDGVEAHLDCDDFDVNISPYQNEVCDFVDNNCNGLVDEGFGSQWWYDLDGDGYGDATHFVPDLLSCAPQTGMVSNNLDCNDADPTINPNVDELCDGMDTNCDGAIDNVDPALMFDQWLDDDGDGYGAGVWTQACELLPGYAELGDDCDDNAPAVNPGADEVCDGMDNDCDTLVDNDATDQLLWYSDLDGDGFGAVELPVGSCESPGVGFVEQSGDCEDNAATVNPDAEEVCDGIDNNCDLVVDSDDCDSGKDKDEGGCGCAHSPGPGGLMWVLALFATLVFRRRSAI